MITVMRYSALTRERAVRNPATGRTCFSVCTRVGRNVGTSRPRLLTSCRAKRRVCQKSRCVLKDRMRTGTRMPNEGYTGSSVSVLLIQTPVATRRFARWTWWPKSRMTSRLKSRIRTFAKTRIVPAEKEVSMSTRRTPQFA